RAAPVPSPLRPTVHGAGLPRAARSGPSGRARRWVGHGSAAAGARCGLRQRAGGVPEPANLGAGAQPAGAALVRLASAAGSPRAGPAPQLRRGMAVAQISGTSNTRPTGPSGTAGMVSSVPAPTSTPMRPSATATWRHSCAA
ncbi:PRODH isoform 7, partial [Pongo abelii]